MNGCGRGGCSAPVRQAAMLLAGPPAGSGERRRSGSSPCGVGSRSPRPEMGPGRRLRSFGACRAPVHPRCRRRGDSARRLGRRTPGTCAALVRALLSVGYQLAASVEQETTGRLATVRLVSSVADAGDVIVDVLFASSGIEAEIVAGAEPLEILEGFTVPVASTGHLIALKLLSRDDETPPQDLADLHALLATAMSEDIELARVSVGLIADRGFDRGRDLKTALEDALRRRTGG